MLYGIANHTPGVLDTTRTCPSENTNSGVITSISKSAPDRHVGVWASLSLIRCRTSVMGVQIDCRDIGPRP